MNIEDGGEQITNTQDIYRTLKSLQLSRSQLTVKIGGDRSSYASMTMHVDLQRQQFVIDELNPEAGNAAVARGETFTIVAYYEGVRVILKGRPTQAKTAHAIASAITLDFPDYIYHKQRRNAFRAPLQTDTPSSVLLTSSQRQAVLQGRVTDLSTSGVGCEFNGVVRPEIDRHEHFENCTLKINGEFELRCSLVARPANYHRRSDRYTCGFRFAALDRQQQKHIDRYVLAIQRQARKAQLEQRQARAALA